MKMALAMFGGDNLTRKQYDSCQQNVYDWDKNYDTIEKDSYTKNGLSRNVCHASVNKTRRILNDESRSKIAADIDFNQQNGIPTSNKGIKSSKYI